MLQTILGAGGAIGKELAQELKEYTNHIRIVSRHPKKISDTDELLTADLTDAASTAKAIEGSQIVYLVAGIPYNTKIWQTQWPVIMHNVIAGCKMHKAKLVFFDNIYMYDKNGLHNTTEQTAVKPCSKKGVVREQIARMVLDETNSGNLNAMIVRSADFYGPAVENSLIGETVYKNLKKGKKAMWLVDATKIHSATYVPDAANATALLGNTPDAYGELWHLPTDDEKIRGTDWVKLFAKEMEVTPSHTVLSKLAVRFLGLFIPVLKESYEMLYQYDRDYFFNSDKFKARFPQFKITSYKVGVKNTVQG